MIVLPWSNDYKTNIEVLDIHREGLFEDVNSFSVMCDIRIDEDKIAMFIENLIFFIQIHFPEEEEIMKSYSYPLLKYHMEMHNDLAIRLLEIESKIKNLPKEDSKNLTIAFVSDLLIHHIAKEDVVFADYCNERNFITDLDLENCRCEVVSMNNNFLGKGEVLSIDTTGNQMHLSIDTSISIKINELVKVSISKPSVGVQVYCGVVISFNRLDVKIFNPRILVEKNIREYFRVAIDLETEVILRNTTKKGTILDLSVGGIQFVSIVQLNLSDRVQVKFNILDKFISLNCKIVRLLKENSILAKYGCQFLDPKESELELISEYILIKQRMLKI